MSEKKPNGRKKPSMQERVAHLEDIVVKQTNILLAVVERLQMLEDDVDGIDNKSKPPALILPERMQ